MSIASIGATVGGLGGLASGAAGIASLFGGGGDSKPSASPIRSTNPAGGVLAELFGFTPFLDKKGRVNYAPYDANSQYWGAPGIQSGLFGPNFKADLESYINNAPALGQQGDIQSILAGIPDDLKKTLGLFDQSIIPAAQQLVNTGFRTDIQPVRDYALRQFNRQDLPNIAEQFAGQTGTMSTDFLQSAQQAATDMEYQLGALQAQYDESANQRRAAGIPVLGSVATTRMGLPGATANDLFDVNKKLFDQQQSADPGLRAFNIFSVLSGLGAPNQQGPVTTGQFPSQTSNLLSGLASAAPGFGQALGGIDWGKMFGGSTSAQTSTGASYGNPSQPTYIYPNTGDNNWWNGTGLPI